MQKIVVSLLLVLFSGFVCAQQEAAAQLKAQLQQLKTFSAAFSQLVTDAEGNSLQEATGTLYLQQPNKLRWQLEAPDETILVADGENLWHIDPFVEQAVVSYQDQAVQSNPIILLAEPDSDHWQNFRVTQQAQGFAIVALDEDSQIAELRLLFDGEKLTQLIIIDRQQQQSRLDFSNILQNQPLAASLFEVQIPEGFAVDDQRY